MRELGLNAWKTVAVHGQIQDEEAQKGEAQKKKNFGIPGARDRKLYGNCCTGIRLIFGESILRGGDRAPDRGSPASDQILGVCVFKPPIFSELASPTNSSLKIPAAMATP
ncbi:hypothetical protein PGTUg99_036743 [Puccinia graminis f. sp. tritici]|uniref:Uncharacterized protein n=1 Tax=Puccinia graminis f. sp. tritici TaxID=56615 RepID=A0A5B0MHM7_PUCGR|nr:hypothetical protein PGTUg99_036743 [Puccinia graminis f. sp. tritici]